MKHAGAQALDQIEPLLSAIRARGRLIEKKRGIFYLKSRSFLHFHEDPAGMFADLRKGDDFIRLRVSERDEQSRFLGALDEALGHF